MYKRQHENGELRYAGKVGTGFDTEELLRQMEVMRPLEQQAAAVKAPRAAVRGAHWLKPRLVAEIAFPEMTNEGTPVSYTHLDVYKRQHENGELRYAGKVGTGFDTEELLRQMEVMRPLEQQAAAVKAPRAAVRGAHWLKPRLVAEIAFPEMTNEGTPVSYTHLDVYKRQHENGELRYAGKVGTGFDTEELLRQMEVMRPLEQQAATVKAPRAEVRGAHWLKPRLVAEIAFTEMTNEGTLRHPSYLGLREDKKPEAVVVETETPVAEATASPAVSVPISNRDRVIYPESSITKGQLADYYAAVAPIMLPWVGSRPISLVRCPQGRAKKCFFQKHDAGSFGDAVHHVAVMEKDGHEEPYLYIDSPEGLLTCVQMGTIEFHGWGARIEDVEKADRLVFDLDPDVGLDFEAVRAAAFQFRDILWSIGLETFPMLTGGKGVHVIAPLTPRAEWPEVKDFAHRLAQAVAQSDPGHFTAALPKAQRKGRIFVDYLRNQRGATAVMPYSARSRDEAPVAAPITWKEMETIDKPSHFHVGDQKELLKRAASKALSGWGRAEQELPDL